MEDENPYCAPENVGAILPRRTPGAAHKLAWLWVGWTAVFLVNLPEPFFFCTEVVSKHGAAGMFVAAAVLFLLGGGISAARRNLGLALVFGGVPVGLSQIFPVLHFAALLIALGLGQFMGVAEFQEPVGHRDLIGQATSELGGFVVTIFMGGMLMGAALLLGMLIRAVAPIRKRSGATPDERRYLN